jgi:hypothetical protein
MPQFDSLIIFSLIFSISVSLIIYYTMSLTLLIPNYFGTKKFREKKLNLNEFYKVFQKNFELKAPSSASVTL